MTDHLATNVLSAVNPSMAITHVRSLGMKIISSFSINLGIYPVFIECVLRASKPQSGSWKTS